MDTYLMWFQPLKVIKWRQLDLSLGVNSLSLGVNNRRVMHKGRLEAFSDGVIAIIITIMA